MVVTLHFRQRLALELGEAVVPRHALGVIPQTDDHADVVL